MTTVKKLVSFVDIHHAMLERAAPPTRARAAGDYLGALVSLHSMRWKTALDYLTHDCKLPRREIAEALTYLAGRVTGYDDRAGGIARHVRPGSKLANAVGQDPFESDSDPWAAMALCDLIDEYNTQNQALRDELLNEEE